MKENTPNHYKIVWFGTRTQIHTLQVLRKQVPINCTGFHSVHGSFRFNSWWKSYMCRDFVGMQGGMFLENSKYLCSLKCPKPLQPLMIIRDTTISLHLLILDLAVIHKCKISTVKFQSSTCSCYSWTAIKTANNIAVWSIVLGRTHP